MLPRAYLYYHYPTKDFLLILVILRQQEIVEQRWQMCLMPAIYSWFKVVEGMLPNDYYGWKTDYNSFGWISYDDQRSKTAKIIVGKRGHIPSIIPTIYVWKVAVEQRCLTSTIPNIAISGQS